MTATNKKTRWVGPARSKRRQTNNQTPFRGGERSEVNGAKCGRVDEGGEMFGTEVDHEGGKGVEYPTREPPPQAYHPSRRSIPRREVMHSPKLERIHRNGHTEKGVQN